MPYYARKTAHLCSYFNGIRLTGETIVSGLPPADISFNRAAELRLAKFRMMEHGLIGDNFSAIALGCGTCKSCIPLRINLDSYAPTKSLEANARKNQDLKGGIDFTEGKFFLRGKSAELFKLFKSYIGARHAESDMANYTYDDFLAFALPQSHILTLEDSEGKILAAALLDIETDPSVHKAIHFHYAFYDPDTKYNSRSLGTALWLAGIKFAKERGFQHVYVGAGAAGSPKLGYKLAYPGLEAYSGTTWEPYDPARHTQGPDHTDWLRQNTVLLPPAPAEY